MSSEIDFGDPRVVNEILRKGQKNPLSETEARSLLNTIFNAGSFKNCFDSEEAKQVAIEKMLENRRNKRQEDPSDIELRQEVLNITSDLVGQLFYYGRKEDSTLSIEKLNDLIRRGVITSEDITTTFKIEVENVIKEIRAS